MRLVELAYFTDDVDAMAEFYGRLLGTDPVTQTADMAVFQAGSTRVFIHRSYAPGEGELPPTNHTAFEVADIDVACTTLQAQGLVLEVGPRDYYWGRSAYLRDPDGHQIELIQSL